MSIATAIGRAPPSAIRIPGQPAPSTPPTRNLQSNLSASRGFLPLILIPRVNETKFCLDPLIPYERRCFSRLLIPHLGVVALLIGACHFRVSASELVYDLLNTVVSKAICSFVTIFWGEVVKLHVASRAVALLRVFVLLVRALVVRISERAGVRV